MTLADPIQMTAQNPDRAKSAPGGAVPTIRDPRLDFFRGMTMFIILIAHTPGNWLTLWIPARFGFSDATEVFVFCSGMASAIAFGKVFRDQGLPMGTARVAFRCWQVYWAHICLFIAIAVTMAALNASELFSRDYVGQLNLYPFFKDPMTNLPALVTLRYVPNYFDILPMYLVVLAMMPVVIALYRFAPLAALGFIVLVWAAADLGGLALPAEPWSEREWFFNPFGWQLVFFTGFALMSGWLPVPPVDRRLIMLAAAVVLVIVPLSYFRLLGTFPELREVRNSLSFFTDKTDFGLLRYVHFLALAYLAWVAVGPKGARLLPPSQDSLGARIWRFVLKVIMKVGQQSLAVFIASMYLARLLGVLLDVLGRNYASMFFVNMLGFALLIGVAYGAGWFKSQPWRQRAGVR
ncbi:OpgC family protein [Sulfitobacter sp. TBRI5]|uniref:OpgC family protein n=1 Tax=Sulfitobacter sp. TBRI5 TaxID=2989732 RepID=UPI003D9B7242